MIRFLDGSLVTETYAADGLRRKTNAFGTIFQYAWDEENLLLWADV